MQDHMIFQNSSKTPLFIKVLAFLFCAHDGYGHDKMDNERDFFPALNQQFIRINPSNNGMVMGQSLYDTSLFTTIDPWSVWTDQSSNDESTLYYQSFHTLIESIPCDIQDLTVTLYTSEQALLLRKFTRLQTLRICIDQMRLMQTNALAAIKGSDILWRFDARLEAAMKVFSSQLHFVKETCYPWVQFSD